MTNPRAAQFVADSVNIRTRARATGDKTVAGSMYDQINQVPPGSLSQTDWATVCETARANGDHHLADMATDKLRGNR